MKTKCLLYCTKAQPYLAKEKWNTTDKPNKWIITNIKEMDWAFDFVNGTIVAECEVECEEIRHYPFEAPEHPRGYQIAYDTESIEWFDLTKFSCLSRDELFDYLKDNIGYAIHINNLKLFDKPLTIEALYQPIDNNFCKKCKEYNTCDYAKSKIKPCKKVLLQAPQNMCWVWYKGERYCLISIRSPWYCKILNGEKTIEVRKKILKGMI